MQCDDSLKSFRGEIDIRSLRSRPDNELKVYKIPIIRQICLVAQRLQAPIVSPGVTVIKYMG